MEDPFSHLNDKQKEAVEHIDGPLLILAGAGTGKTMALINRIVNILRSEKAYPAEILAVTFTNKAAREMQERISALVPLRLKWLGTFHSIGAKILRINAEAANLSSNFSIIDVDDQVRLVKSISNDLNVDTKQFNPKIICSIIQQWKDLALAPDEVSNSDIKSEYHSKALHIYKEYQRKLFSNDSVDFGDLLMLPIHLFRRNPHILAQYQTTFKYILVDEYQDTNTAQYIWLRMLAQKHQNICCVGDDDQSIYGWRGAEIGNILRFEEDFPGAKIIKLEQNYRSTSCILGAASSLISNNNMRHDKTLWTEKSSGDDKIIVRSFFNDKEEANFIAREILHRFMERLETRKVAILVRALFQTRIIEECFMRARIPYKVVGSLKFYERQEIRDIVAYIKLAVKCNDDLPFERIINKPARSVGKTTLQKIKDFANERQISLFSATEMMLQEGAFTKKTTESLTNFVSLIKKWHEEFQSSHHTDVVKNILTDSGYEALLRQEDSIEGKGRLENSKELLKALDDFKSILDFLDHITLVTDNDEASSNDRQDIVTIMTLHAAKGLEFNTVFLPGWEEGLFPHSKSIDESGEKGLEEERRLAYVGMTRAKKNLYISHSLTRRMYNQWIDSMPSRFLKEIPKEFLMLPPN